MSIRIGLLAGVAVCACMGAVEARAAIFTDRDSVYSITFSGGLDTASTQYDVTTTLPAGGSDSLGGSLGFKSGFQNFVISTTGTVTTTYTTPSMGSTSMVGDILNGGGGGTFHFGYSTENGPDFSTSWTISAVANGRHVLAFGGIGSQGFGGCGTGLLDTGGIFTCEVFIQGDHPAGMGAGDAYVTNLSAGYGIVDNFVYNSALNATILSVSTGDYQGVGPDLGVNIVGAAVPEPMTWATVLVGFGGLGLLLRSSRRRRAVAA
jgi:hypothetical protein